MADDGSSYIRVYRLLLETPGGKELRARVREAYEGLRWEKHEFYLSGTTAQCYWTTTKWGTRGGHRLGEGQNAVSYFDVEFSAGDFLSKDDLDSLLDRYFGKPTTGPHKVVGAVPTFNVNKDVVRGVDKDGKAVERVKGGVTTPSFSAWAIGAIDEETREVYKATKMRLEAEKQAVLATEDFEDRRRAALRALARKDMIDVVRKWIPMGVTFIEETWQEAVISMVMER